MTIPRITPITNPSLDTEWKTPLPKDLMSLMLFGYCGAHHAARLAAASKEIYAQFSEEFDRELEDMLQHTAECDYQIQLVYSENFPDIEEDTLYLKHFFKKIEFKFMKPNTNTVTEGEMELKQIPYGETELPSNTLLVLKYIKKKHDYLPPLKAVWMARNNHALLLTKKTFTEEWGGKLVDKRMWHQPLSALQYAVWAGDTPMVHEFLKILPAELKPEALQQLMEVRDNKLERPHLSAIQELRDQYAQTKFSGWEKALLIKQLGSVANLLQWFYSNTPFDPFIPTFQKLSEPRYLTSSLSNIADHQTSRILMKENIDSDSGCVFLPANIENMKRDDWALHVFSLRRKDDLARQIKKLECNFATEVKALLCHTAACDYAVHFLPDGFYFPIEEEDLLYLEKNGEKEIKFKYIKRGEKEFTFGSVFFNSTPDQLDRDTTWEILPGVLDPINFHSRYQFPLMAIWMARKNPALIVGQSEFTETWCEEERKWNRPISPLQYAAWAGDTPMVEEFLKILSYHPEMQTQALQQLKDVRDGNLERAHLSAVENLRDEYARNRFGCRRMTNWQQTLLNKQLQSVVNLLQWFCSTTAFHPVPSFEKFPKMRSLMINNDSALDASEVLVKGCGKYCGYMGKFERPQHWHDNFESDFRAVSHFCEVRKRDLTRQIDNLESALQVQAIPSDPRVTPGFR